MRVRRSRLPEILHQRGMTQQQLAERVRMSPTQISYYATGQRVMSLKTAKKISGVLRVSLDDLYEWETDAEDE